MDFTMKYPDNRRLVRWLVRRVTQRLAEQLCTNRKWRSRMPVTSRVLTAHFRHADHNVWWAREMSWIVRGFACSVHEVMVEEFRPDDWSSQPMKDFKTIYDAWCADEQE